MLNVAGHDGASASSIDSALPHPQSSVQQGAMTGVPVNLEKVPPAQPSKASPSSLQNAAD